MDALGVKELRIILINMKAETRSLKRVPCE